MKNTTTPQKPPVSDPRPESAGDSGETSTQSRPTRRSRRSNPVTSAGTQVIVKLGELKSSGFDHEQAATIVNVAYDAIAENVDPILNKLNDIKARLAAHGNQIGTLSSEVHDPILNELNDIKATLAAHGIQICTPTSEVHDPENTLTSEIHDPKTNFYKMVTHAMMLLLFIGAVGFYAYIYLIEPKFERFNDRISALELEVVPLNVGVEGLDQRLDKKVDRLDEKVDRLDEK